MNTEPWFVVVPAIELTPEEELLDEWFVWQDEYLWENSSMDEQYPV